MILFTRIRGSFSFLKLKWLGRVKHLFVKNSSFLNGVDERQSSSNLYFLELWADVMAGEVLEMDMS